MRAAVLVGMLLGLLACTNAAPAETPLAGTFQVSEIAARYSENEIGADAQFKDRHIAIVGPVKRIEKDLLGAMVLELDVPGSFATVASFLEPSEVTAAAALRSGDVVTVSGDFRGKKAAGLTLFHGHLLARPAQR